jgi:hypothetical protein
VIRRDSSSPRFRVALLLLALALATSGCVYLRLLQLKNQLADFEKNFRVTTTTGVTVECLKPLLQPGDVRWLGVEPEEVFPRGNENESWKVRWLKEAPPNANETLLYDVELAADFSDEKLARVTIPERYFAFFPKELFVNLLRSTGAAKIDRKAREAEVTQSTPAGAPPPQLPNLRSIAEMLGAPTSRTAAAGKTTCVYRYKPVTTVPKAKSIEVTFVFDEISGDLQTLTARLPTGTIHFNVAPKAEKPDAKTRS